MQPNDATASLHSHQQEMGEMDEERMKLENEFKVYIYNYDQRIDGIFNNSAPTG